MSHAVLYIICPTPSLLLVDALSQNRGRRWPNISQTTINTCDSYPTCGRNLIYIVLGFVQVRSYLIKQLTLLHEQQLELVPHFLELIHLPCGLHSNRCRYVQNRYLLQNLVDSSFFLLRLSEKFCCEVIICTPVRRRAIWHRSNPSGVMEACMI